MNVGKEVEGKGRGLFKDRYHIGICLETEASHENLFQVELGRLQAEIRALDLLNTKLRDVLFYAEGREKTTKGVCLQRFKPDRRTSRSTG
jgi:hypothetical protein